MNRALFNRRLRLLHLWLGLAIGGQVGIWLISGLFMTWFPIETVRGDHLRSEMAPVAIELTANTVSLADAVEVSGVAPQLAEARQVAKRPVWYIEGSDKKLLIDARSGEIISPLSQQTATDLAKMAYAGAGDFLDATFYEQPPREYGRPGPVWRIDLGAKDAASFYVDATTGDVRAVRTLLWRVFDFMWGLHIMDWSTRENFNSWWIKMTASLAVMFFLAGLGLSILRVTSMLKR